MRERVSIMKFCIMICSVAASFAMLAGCAKIPEKLDSPTLKIEPVIINHKEMFNLKLSAGIRNENSGTALVSIKGNIVFADPAGKNARVLSVPFNLPIILPFDMGIIEIDKNFSEGEIMPLVALMGSDREKLMRDKILERSVQDERDIRLELTEYRKENILGILKGKIDEKI